MGSDAEAMVWGAHYARGQTQSRGTGLGVILDVESDTRGTDLGGILDMEIRRRRHWFEHVIDKRQA